MYYGKKQNSRMSLNLACTLSRAGRSDKRTSLSVLKVLLECVELRMKCQGNRTCTDRSVTLSLGSGRNAALPLPSF